MELLVRVEVAIEPDEGGFHAFCPALKGLHVDGSTQEEALENAKVAVEVYLDSLIKHGEPIPVGVTIEEACTPLKGKSLTRQIESRVLVPA